MWWAAKIRINNAVMKTTMSKVIQYLLWLLFQNCTIYTELAWLVSSRGTRISSKTNLNKIKTALCVCLWERDSWRRKALRWKLIHPSGTQSIMKANKQLRLNTSVLKAPVKSQQVTNQHYSRHLDPNQTLNTGAKHDSGESVTYLLNTSGIIHY